jgi:hypothetical protein
VSDGKITGSLSQPDTECVRARCDCLFLLWKDGQTIAACPTYEAHDAARRLLGQKP